jgi:hypothetical protein
VQVKLPSHTLDSMTCLASEIQNKILVENEVGTKVTKKGAMVRYRGGERLHH